jgi:hypothetical protein
MAETRIDKDIPIFGENALTGEIKEFGTTTDSTDINELLSTTEAGRGWFFLGTTDFPTKEQFNAVGYSLTKFIKYLYERGIAEWNTNVNYPIGGWVIASNGRPYRALTANSGNDPIGDTTNWEQPVLFQEKDKNVTHDITVDSDYTLTDDQNLYGRINITDTGVVLTTARNIIVDNVEKNSFIFENSTAQDLTVKTSAGTGILVSSGETKVLRNDGTNVLDSDIASESSSFGVNQSWQNLTSSRSLGVTYTNTKGKAIGVYIFFADSDNNGVPTSFTIDGVSFVSAAGTGMINTMLSFIVPNGSTYSVNTTNAGITIWNELR